MLKAALLCIFFVMTLLSACHRRDENETSKETVPAADLIKQSENLYKERDDLDNLREGIVFLKRARNAEPHNFEANWELAKFASKLCGSPRNRQCPDALSRARP